MKSIWTESTAKVAMFANCEKNGARAVVGLTAKGRVVDPLATETKGSDLPLAPKVGSFIQYKGTIVTSAVPSANVVTGTYSLVVI